MKNCVLLLCLFLVQTSLYSQRPGKNWEGKPSDGLSVVKGIIQDEETSQALEFATISIFDEKEALIGGNASDENGQFVLKVPKGKYKAIIEYLGYSTQTIDVDISSGKPFLDIGIIFLSAEGAMLDDIEIRAEKSETIFKLDKKVFNVGSDLANKGGTAEDILDNVPSVSVDIEGNINLRGSGNVKILLNGQPSAMLNDADGNALRQIQASSIERIEVITNPSARYEAEGTSGIINIVLKKENRKGFNGSFTAGVSFPLGYNLGGQVNYKSGKVNYFLNYSNGLRRNIGGGFQNSFFIFDDYLLIQNYENFRDRKGLNQNVVAGLDLELAKNQVLTFSGSFSISDEDNLSEYEYVDSIYTDISREYIETTYRRDDEFEDELNQEYTVRYTNDFGRKDKSLTAFITYTESNEVEGSQLSESYEINNTNTLSQRSNNDEGEASIIGQIDFTFPLSKSLSVETGSRVSLRDIGNTFLVEELVEDQWTTLDAFNNSFIYNEDVFALYTIIGKEWDKFSVQSGLRAEYSSIETQLIETNEGEDYNYLDLFPSVFLNYKTSPASAWQINYSRRITRPRFWYLNPFFTFSNNRTIWSGNPTLRPEYTHSIELNHLRYLEKGTISTGLYYKHTDALIQRLQTINTDGTTSIKPYNIGTQDQIGLELSANYSINRAIRFDGNANIYQFRTRANTGLESGEIQDFTWRGRVGTKLKIAKKTDFQARYNFRGPTNTLQGRRKLMHFLSFGISRDFLNDNLTISLSSNDLFGSRKRRYIFDLDDYYAEGEGRWRGSSVNLSANYRINQKKKRQKQGNFGGDGGGEF